MALYRKHSVKALSMHGLFVQLFSYLKASKYIARTKERSTRIRDVADLPPGRRVQRGDLLRSVLNIKNGVEIKSLCYIDSVGQI